ANWMKRPIFLISFFSMYWPGWKSRTSPAIWQENALASNAVIFPMPLLLARIPCQVSSVPIPKGDTKPTPVTTTLRDTQLLLIDLALECYFLEVLLSM